MTKYKEVGLANLVVGTIHIAGISLSKLLVQPKMESMYSDFGKSVSQSSINNYLIMIIAGIAVLNLFFGFKNYFSVQENDKFYKYGQITVVLGVLLLGLHVIYSIYSIITPIYSFTKQF